MDVLHNDVYIYVHLALVKHLFVRDAVESNCRIVPILNIREGTTMQAVLQHSSCIYVGGPHGHSLLMCMTVLLFTPPEQTTP